MLRLLMTVNGYEAKVIDYLAFYFMVIVYGYLTLCRLPHLKAVQCQHFHKTKNGQALFCLWNILA